MTKIKVEAFDCMQYMYHEVQPPIIRCCFSMNNNLDISLLKQAVKLLKQKNPVLGCKINIRAKEWIQSGWDINEYIRMKEDPDNWEQAVTDSILYTLQETEPPIKLLLVRREAEDFLCITVSHMVCDGRGFVQLLYQLSDIYTSLETGHADEASLSESLHLPDNRSFKQITETLTMKDKMHAVFQPASVSSKDTLKPLPLETKNESEYIISKCIDEQKLRNIIAYAKKYDAGVNDMILTAYTRAIHQMFGWNRVTLPCPVDLRRFLSSGREAGVCNLTSNYFCSVELKNQDGFRDTLQVISKQIKQQKQELGCLGGPVLLHMLYHVLPYSLLRKVFFHTSPVPVTSYTNIGILDDKQLCFGSCELKQAYIVTAEKRAPYYQLTVSTFQNKCTLTSCFSGNQHNYELVDQLMNHILDEFDYM